MKKLYGTPHDGSEKEAIIYERIASSDLEGDFYFNYPVTWWSSCEPFKLVDHVREFEEFVRKKQYVGDILMREILSEALTMNVNPANLSPDVAHECPDGTTKFLEISDDEHLQEDDARANARRLVNDFVKWKLTTAVGSYTTIWANEITDLDSVQNIKKYNNFIA